MRGARGFSLVEILVVLAILGVLSSVALPFSEMTAKRARESELRIALREMRLAIDAYKRAYDEGRIAPRPGASGYPRSLDELVEGAVDAKSPGGARIHFLRRIPADPMTPGDRAAPRWGLRSYASPASDPQPGDDVYDIFSPSDRVGINGLPYRQW
jgi:general secretion pathway protein G